MSLFLEQCITGHLQILNKDFPIIFLESLVRLYFAKRFLFNGQKKKENSFFFILSDVSGQVESHDQPRRNFVGTTRSTAKLQI